MSEGSQDPRVRRRVGGPTVSVLIDFLAQSRATRSWMVLVIVGIAVLAASAAFVGKTVVPLAIYGGL